jgi:Cof subfamily protein (haloacid dehalogenase superfamily)
MGEKYLIALDLDGTLLKDDKTIATKTKKVLEKAKEQGHMVMIATGRPFRSSQSYYYELGLNTPMVNFNGAFVHHPLSDNWGLFHTPLDISVAKDIVDACYTYQFHNIIAEVIDDVYFHYHDEKLIELFNTGQPKIKTGDLRRSLTDSPTSLLIHTDEKYIKSISDYLSNVHAEVIHQRSWRAPWHVIEIVKSGLNKAVGLRQVSNYLNIPKERIIAFGDEDNDLEMLDYAHYGIAMGNGITELKNIAFDTTLTNEEDGVAIYLNDLLNLKAI